MGKLLVTTGSLPIDPRSLSALSVLAVAAAAGSAANPALLSLNLFSPAGAADCGGHFVLRKKKMSSSAVLAS